MRRRKVTIEFLVLSAIPPRAFQKYRMQLLPSDLFSRVFPNRTCAGMKGDAVWFYITKEEELVRAFVVPKKPRG